MNIEVLAPSGSYDSLAAAIRAGADSVYFGAGELNMRAKSSFNFKEEDIFKVAKLCSKMGVKSYLAVNTIIFDDEIERIREILNTAKKANVTAIIASDLAVITMAHKLGLTVHISVQTNITNIEAVRFFAQYAEVMVLARELTLQQIAEICNKIKSENIRGPSGNLVRIEVFAHGALCVSVSGKCYMSLATYNKSANRGACVQNCRRAYKIIDEQNGHELLIDNKYVMSPKDICTIRCLDKILNVGVSILKLEGRGRSSDYVFTVTKIYKDAVNAIKEGIYTKEKVDAWEKELENVFNRGLWHGGYYLGEEMEMWSNLPDNRAKVTKVRIGVVTNYFAKIGIAEITLREGELSLGEEILFTGDTTGAYSEIVQNIRLEGRDVPYAEKGKIISIVVNKKVRRNDAVFALREEVKNLRHEF